MDQLIVYLLQSSASIILFYVCFALVLRRESYFGFNRIYLIGALIFSTTLPFLSYNLYELFAQTGGQASSIYVTYQLTAYQLNEVVIGNAVESSGGFNSMHILTAIFLTGMFLKMGQFGLRMIQFYRFSSKYEQYKIGNLVFVITEEGSPTFSFLNYIFIARKLYENKNEFNSIIQHEKVHSDQYHSVDLIIAELIIIVQWFNPAAYFLRNLIKENHEFLADGYVLGADKSFSKYRTLLLEHSSIVKTNILTHNFSYSLIKRRLNMIKKSKNPIRFGLGIIGAIVTSALVIVACSRADQSTDPAGDELSHKTGIDSTYTEVENMPQYPGGMDSLVSYLSSNIVYPEAAKKDSITGKVFISFVVEKDGQVSDVSILRGIGGGCDKEAIRVVSMMPNWKPGLDKGKAVRVKYNLPIKFALN